MIRLSMREGGSDYRQQLELLREGLEEVLRVEVLLPASEDKPSAFDRIYAFFSCFAAVASCRKALLFSDKEAVKGAPGPPPIDIDKLPARVGLDMQRHLQRQAVEGALGYSAAAMQAAQKQLLFRSVVRHAIALRRECDLFGSLFQPERLICDQFHVTLALASEAYAKARILDAAPLKTIETPTEAPSEGDVLIIWTRPDLTAAGKSSAGPPPSECSSLLAFVCASAKAEEDVDPAESRHLVARSPDVHLASLRRLADILATDLQHCRPATAVAAAHVEQRLREVACTLRGSAAGSSGGAEAKGGDERLDASLAQLLMHLAGEQADPDGGPPKLLESQLVQAAIQAMIRLLDPSVGAAKVSHPQLARFLRSVLTVRDLLPGR